MPCYLPALWYLAYRTAGPRSCKLGVVFFFFLWLKLIQVEKDERLLFSMDHISDTVQPLRAFCAPKMGIPSQTSLILG